MYLSKLIQCETISGSLVSFPVRITDEVWSKCPKDVQDGVAAILANEPIKMLAPSQTGQRGLKFENSHWVFNTKTAGRLSTGKCSNDDWNLQGLTFDSYYNH